MTTSTIGSKDKELLRAAAFGSFRARDVVFGEKFDYYSIAILEAIKDIDRHIEMVYASEANIENAHARRRRAVKLKQKLIALRDQMANVRSGDRKVEDYHNMELLLSDPTRIVNMMLSKIVPLPGALRFQPKNAVYLQDDLDVLHQALVRTHPDVAEALNVVTEWIEDDAEEWRKNNQNFQHIAED